MFFFLFFKHNEEKQTILKNSNDLKNQLIDKEKVNRI
jgi:hypothetical protein